ncbi:MAG: hypothetical protein PHF35_02255 [Candidatus Moranbacteria bacterium]|nr:hypothetical protein [Candidatus Moranbacteria bacterium]
MQKQISTRLGILILIFVALIFAGVVNICSLRVDYSSASRSTMQPKKDAKELACVNAGGKISQSLCCQSANDFSNTCAIGACGCAPDHSHQVKACDCGEGKCFDGKSCVSVNGGAGLGSEKACTMEARQCPDGSYVGRSGPNCDFSPCPGAK